MEEKLMPRIDFTEYCKDKYIIDLGNYEIKKENGKTYAVRKQSKYPKTYEECLEILGYNIAHTIPMNHGHNGLLMMKFQRLLIYRDAYLRIAGKEMGLGKPWEPVLGENFIYAIGTCYGTIEKRMVTGGSGILLFPTEEMRDAFYENFKELIEECKCFL